MTSSPTHPAPTAPSDCCALSPNCSLPNKPNKLLKTLRSIFPEGSEPKPSPQNHFWPNEPRQSLKTQKEAKRWGHIFPNEPDEALTTPRLCIPAKNPVPLGGVGLLHVTPASSVHHFSLNEPRNSLKTLRS